MNGKSRNLVLFLSFGVLCGLIVFSVYPSWNNVERIFREKSCDIETTLYYLRKNKSILVNNYAHLVANAVPIGGYDWTFTKTVPCVLNSSLFNFTRRERYQTLLSCSNSTISVKKSLVNEKSVDQIFAFPDVCLGEVISSFCGDGKPVPNVIHYIWFGNMTFDFIYFVSIYSAHKYQKPCLIFLYYELLPSGTWWNLLRKIVDNIVLVKMRPPMMISGKMIKFVQHKSDIVRLKILKEYGGIYVDTDQYFLRSEDEFRTTNCTMGMAHDKAMGSALIFAKKDASFINKWIDSYSFYDPTQWGLNSVLMATKLSQMYPTLLRVISHHCVFFPHGLVLFNQNYKWSHSYGLHIFKTGRIQELRHYNFYTIRKINNTIGAMFRYILFDNKELCFN